LSWFSLSLSVLAALLVAFMLWLIQNRVFRPRIHWSKEIAFEVDSSNSDRVHQFAKVKNQGLRSMVDVEVVCILRYLIPESARSDFSSRAEDPHGESDRHLVCEIPSVGVPVPMLNRGATRTISLNTYGIEKDQIEQFPPALRDCLNQSPPHSLLRVVSSMPGCSIRIFISATDAISRSRIVSVNVPAYESTDVLEGKFERDSLSFVPVDSK
jgi:hypothetical protein